MPDIHARFSPSAAEQFINCPPSLVLGEQSGDKDETSEYAAEGTEAHTVFAICENTETGEAMVCYYDSKHDWVRPASMWLDKLQCTCKRFELIERSRI